MTDIVVRLISGECRNPITFCQPRVRNLGKKREIHLHFAHLWCRIVDRRVVVWNPP